MTVNLALVMAVIDDYNEVDNLLSTMRPFVDEIVIGIDSGSQDVARLEETTKRHGGISVVCPPATRQGTYYGAKGARNIALNLVTAPWVFLIDSDEIPGDGLMEWVRSFVDAPEAAEFGGIEIHRENRIGGGHIGDRTYEWHMRLFRSHYRLIGLVHDMVLVQDAAVGRAPEELYIRHHKSWQRQIAQNERYKLSATQDSDP